MLEAGYIKLYRSLLNWEWYDDVNTKVVFLHLLLTVSIEDSRWHGIMVKRGSRVSSYAKLAEETRLSVRQIRTAIDHLEATNEVTRTKHPKYTVFAINNYDKYQSPTSNVAESRQGSDKVATSNRQGSDNSIRKYKKVKEDKEDIEGVTAAPSPTPPKAKNTRFVPPTVEDVAAYCAERQNNIDAVRFVDYYTSNGWMVGKSKMKDWKATVRNWERREKAGNQTAQESIPKSDNAAAYKGFIYNLEE